jgi:hypothetical protein
MLDDLDSCGPAIVDSQLASVELLVELQQVTDIISTSSMNDCYCHLLVLELVALRYDTFQCVF